MWNQNPFPYVLPFVEFLIIISAPISYNRLFISDVFFQSFALFDFS